ncbi:MAG: hypothetical protein ACI9JY_003255, partial [Saprospiraceae bacterium]
KIYSQKRSKCPTISKPLKFNFLLKNEFVSSLKTSYICFPFQIKQLLNTTFLRAIFQLNYKKQ